MALATDKLTALQSAVKEVDFPGSIKLPDSGSVSGSSLVSVSAKYLKPGQGVVVGSNVFTVKGVLSTKEVLLDSEFKDRTGNRASIDNADLYMDGNLFNLKTCAGKVVYSVSANGSPILHNGLVGVSVAKDVSIDDIKSGLIVATTKDVALKVSDATFVANSLYVFYILNNSSDEVNLNVDATFVKKLAASSLSTVRLFVGTNNAVSVFVDSIQKEA